ncbi:MAG: HAMP domain-containing sensor histidine kinase [Chloroflexi bacterium]|nr:HAMP domain-containing sensor histidine kinase [Chloroflexota bacterium]
MSLRWRILGVLILVIVLTVAWNLAASYYVTQRQFDAFVSELSQREASELARQLSRAYTTTKGWQSVDAALSASGYLYEAESEHQEGSEGSADTEGDEGFHIDRLRVVVVDQAGRNIRDNFAELEAGELTQALKGQRRGIVDLATGQTVGFLYLDVDQNFLETESIRFLRDLLLSSSASGLFILILALSLATSLSRRITAPISALTKATQAIARRDDTTLLPVTSSDELGQMSAAFNEMTKDLQRQRDLRKRLINDVSHELNTPLTVIQLEAKGLLDGLQAPDQAAQHIVEEVKMLRNLVNDLNWLGETDSGELPLNLEPCDIGSLLTSEVERWQPQAEARLTSLSLAPLPQLPTLQLDPGRICQALGNLIHNSLQHTDQGRVIIAAAIKGGRSVQITVDDDGAGIDPADLPQVFHRFYRALETDSPGRGLGLDITRTIIEAHGGSINVQSDGFGCGTRVEFQLPIDKNRAPDSV